MNNAEYDALPGIRRSDLWLMHKTPLQFKYHMEHKENDDSPALVFGRAAHAYILEPDVFKEEYAIIPENLDRRTKEGKELYSRFLDENASKTLISQSDAKMLDDMRLQFLFNPEVDNILVNAVGYEVPYFWTDPETGEDCKCKTDIITMIDDVPYIVDYKTTQSCEDGAFERACRVYGYDFQAGFYVEGVETCMLEEYGFVFIAQEKKEPYLTRVYYCDPGFIRTGKRKFHDLLNKYHNCKITNEWSGYETAWLYGEEYD